LFYGLPIDREGTHMIFDEIARELSACGGRSKDIFTILMDISASMEGLGDGDLRPTLMKIVVGCIAAIQHIDRSRLPPVQMFYILGDRVSVSERGDERNHVAWMIDEGDFDAYDDAIRGHVDETGVYIYEIDEDRFGEVIPRIVNEIMISGDLDVFVAVQGTEPRRLGKVAELL
jgi:hypothetical protein